MTIPLKFASLYDGQKVFVWSVHLLDLGTDFLVSNVAFYWVGSILRWHRISMARILFCSSAVRVHDSQAFKKVVVTRERIGLILR